jgi:DNA repair protein RadC
MSELAGVAGGERPRERLGRVGASPLNDVELLALVLGHGVSGRGAGEIAADLLREVGGVHQLARVSPRRLARVAGVGLAQASRVVAAIELGRRTLSVAPLARLPLRSAAQAAEFLLPRFGAHPVERFGVVMLDARHRLIGVHVISEGSVDRTIAIARDVFREASIVGAAAVLLFHNHPSGDATPTSDDLALTRRLADAGVILGVDVVDHLILADTKYCSLRQHQVFRRPAVPP